MEMEIDRIELLDLPVELLEHLIRFLKLEDLKNFSIVNKKTFDLTNNEIVLKCQLHPKPYPGDKFVDQNPDLNDLCMKFRRRYPNINSEFLKCNRKDIEIVVSNSRIVSMQEFGLSLRGNKIIDVHISVDPSDLRNKNPDFMDSSRDIEKFIQIFSLDVDCKTTKEAWTLINKWYCGGKVKNLRITVETYSEKEDFEYQRAGIFNFREVILDSIGDSKCIAGIINGCSTMLRTVKMVNCRTDFSLFRNSLTHFLCENDYTRNIDEILKAQTKLETLTLENIMFTRSLLRTLDANTNLKNVDISSCCVADDVTEDMFKFVARVKELKIISNVDKLSMFFWNNLETVENLILNLKSSNGLKEKKLNHLKKLGINGQNTATILKKLLLTSVLECSISSPRINNLPSCQTLIVLDPVSDIRTFDKLMKNVNESDTIKTVKLKWTPITLKQLGYLKDCDPRGIDFHIEFAFDSNVDGNFHLAPRN